MKTNKFYFSFSSCLLILAFFFPGCMEDIKKAAEKNTKNDSKNEVSAINSKIALAIHGGAGVIKKENMSDEREKEYIEKLTEALQAGYNILKNNGSSEDAVVAAIEIMENSPLFNAGKGAVFTFDGHNELDASFMSGKDLNAGAVSGVKKIKNPIKAARLVKDKSIHVMLSGTGADEFAKQEGLEIVDNKYFFTERRFKSHQKNKKANIDASFDKKESFIDDFDWEGKKFGTVGAVALDSQGNLAAGTSTGGMTNKRFGRVGDSPLVGIGTYANNKTCAISCTGHGEYFIRGVVAHDISANMEYAGKSLEDAANYVVHEKLDKLGGTGGIIAVDKNGNVSMPFNTAGMYRGWVLDDGKIEVRIFDEKH